MDIGIKKAIQLERLRNLLAVSNKYDLFVNTYNNNYYSIPNLNSGSFWDKTNFLNKYTESSNPMAVDRISTVFKLIIKYTKIIPKNNIKILDIGFGPGDLENLLYQKKNRYSVYGIDKSLYSVINAKSKYPEFIFEKKDVLNISLLKNKYDVITALEILEHISPKYTLKVIKDIFNLLNPKGLLIISIPLNEGLENMLNKGENPNCHVRIYTKNIIKLELILNQFKIIYIKHLFAFHDNYRLKSLISNIFKIRKPNNIIVIAQKK